MEDNKGTGFGWPQVGICAAMIGFAVWGLLAVALPRAAPVAPKHPYPQAVAKLPQPNQAVRGAMQEVDCSRQACLALTFDDGPDGHVTPQVLDILRRHNVRATFYIVGSRVAGNEAILRQMYKDGHEIGNHSWSHTDFTTLNAMQIQQQIASTQAAIAGAGVPPPTTFRPPYGAVNAVVRANVPLTIVRWNIDPEDWSTTNAKDIITKVESTAKPGSVVDMHDIHQQTADALDQLLNDLTQKYQLVTASELFNLPPGQRGEFFGR
ncbi:MAG TPA: polysaccharide deacetylase family protein [Candidatus Saccharimonadales bacterium]|nr:polysaccharide deacetylase family protein [Candidatus Saccharimonadales bacterium]